MRAVGAASTPGLHFWKGKSANVQTLGSGHACRTCI